MKTKHKKRLFDGIGEERVHPAPAENPRDDTLSVMDFYSIRDGFPQNVLDEAERVSHKPISAKGRLDLRNEAIFTCDPVTARDYDDAVSIKTGRGGKRILGIHIADVSEYVTPASALDKEAFKRSTSVYFADKTVPMLPECLSGGVCSLVPGEDRLAFSVFIEFDRNGRAIGRSFAKSVIRSGKRFTYAEVMSIISGSTKYGKWDRIVRDVHHLAMQLRSARFSAGALDIDIPEQEIVLDGTGEMSGIETRPYDESHQMIEECMVAANEAVAAELWGKGIKILARLHEAPDPEKIEELRENARSLGVKCGDISNPKAFTRFLATVKAHPLSPILSVMVLRSMKRAIYDSSKMGHFGLAKRFYSHFTSPIRRYPDLVLHRQLSAYLAGGVARIPPQTLKKTAAHATEMEERAVEAERALLEIKKYRLLENELKSRMPTAYDGVISRIVPYGCFVEIPGIGVYGLVHVSALSRKFVRYDRVSGTLAAPGGERWKTGDSIKVSISHVDFGQRRLDFIPAGKPQ